MYPVTHHPFWRKEFPEMPLPHGSFGENFTIDGLDESSIHIGIDFGSGTPSSKSCNPACLAMALGLRFGNPQMPKRFHASGRCCFFLAVFME